MSKMPELRIDPHVRTGIVADEPGLKVVARAETREYAAQIVTACNAFGPLVEAVQALLRAHTQLMPGIGHIACSDYAIVNEAPLLGRAALAASLKENEHE